MVMRRSYLARICAIAGLVGSAVCWIGYVQQLHIEMAKLSGDDGLRRPLFWWLIGALVSTTIMIVSGAVARLRRDLDAPLRSQDPDRTAIGDDRR